MRNLTEVAFMPDETPCARPQSPSSLRARRALPPFETLRAFDAIARLGGVRKAAEHLCRDHAGVSRHLRTIEAWTSAKLIQRTANGTMLTEEGIRYHRNIESALDIIAQATIELMKRGDSRHLHIRSMHGFALNWLLGRLAEFETANPGLSIELQPTGRYADLLSQDADIDIRMVGSYRPHLQLPPNMQVLELARVPIVAVASRSYLAGAPAIREPRDLLQHQLLHEEDSEGWRAWLAAHGVEDEMHLPGRRFWQGQLTLECARSGRGIALTNLMIAAQDLASGKLVEVGSQQPRFMPRRNGIYYFIARSDRWHGGVVERFRSWLVSRIAQEHPDFAIASPK